MVKELKLCLATALIVVLAVCLYLNVAGNELTLSFDMPRGAVSGSVVSDDEGRVRIKSQKMTDAALVAVFQHVSDGNTAAHVKWEPDSEDMSIYNVDLELSDTFFGGVYENVSGTFSGWHSVVWGIGAFLLACAAVLFKGYFTRRGAEKFSYATMACAGLGLFTLILGVFSVFFAFECMADTGMTMWVLYLRIFTACQSFIIYTSPLAAVFSLALIASNLVLLRREGFALSNLFAVATALFILCGAGFGIWMFYTPVSFEMRNVVCNVYAAFFCYFECMMFAVILLALNAAKSIPDLHTEFLLILGCKIRDDGSLYPLIRSRVDRALEFAETQERAGVAKCIFVPTGGRGADEKLSEGEAMARYLRQHGVPDDRILIEKQSVSTWENMCLSRAVIERQHRGGVRCAFVTSSFHVFRSGMLAAQSGWPIDGMGSHTVWYFWPNAFVREFWGLIGSRIWMHLAVTVLISAFFTAISLLF